MANQQAGDVITQVECSSELAKDTNKDKDE
jgi:hypothetical protein